LKSIGECPIDGEDVFARVMNYETKTPDEAAFEAHQKMVLKIALSRLGL
tara:strand:+ start:13214 stop:13360 length:147 start_codon:yes stop_codon:yes gene_type:complete